jgi:uncharacterized protein YcgI (DUF1989 family)
MTISSEPIIVKGGSGWAGPMPKGSVLRITDVAGQQVGDLVLFREDDVTERFSQANTRKMENTIYLAEGSRLWSTRCSVLAEIERDTVNRHDILSSACSPYDYPIRFGIADHRSCLANLCAALKPYGIPEELIPDPVNVFMRQELSTDGTLSVEPPRSRAGDHVDIRFAIDCIAGISACPQDQNACNGWQITDLRLDLAPPA